jgi:hypothetical protein
VKEHDNVIRILDINYMIVSAPCHSRADPLYSEHFPELVTAFVNKVKDLFTDKAAREQAERERQIAEREKQRVMRKLAKKGRDLER